MEVITDVGTVYILAYPSHSGYYCCHVPSVLDQKMAGHEIEGSPSPMHLDFVLGEV